MLSRDWPAGGKLRPEPFGDWVVGARGRGARDGGDVRRAQAIQIAMRPPTRRLDKKETQRVKNSGSDLYLEGRLCVSFATLALCADQTRDAPCSEPN